MPRLIEGQELIFLQPIIEAARMESLNVTCAKDQRGAIIFKEQTVLGRASNGPIPPYKCQPEKCLSICGLYAMHAERLAIINALEKRQNLTGASILHLRTDHRQIQTSGPLHCEDCTGYMLRVSRKIDLKEFILPQQDGWTAYEISEADQITRQNLHLST